MCKKNLPAKSICIHSDSNMSKKLLIQIFNFKIISNKCKISFSFLLVKQRGPHVCIVLLLYLTTNEINFYNFLIYYKIIFCITLYFYQIFSIGICILFMGPMSRFPRSSYNSQNLNPIGQQDIPFHLSSNNKQILHYKIRFYHFYFYLFHNICFFFSVDPILQIQILILVKSKS